jgi:hypothetical protein
MRRVFTAAGVHGTQFFVGAQNKIDVHEAVLPVRKSHSFVAPIKSVSALPNTKSASTITPSAPVVVPRAPPQ